jgi:hypothetical protein|tara:strand:- start:1042 stop:1503 length:462 start_codon:yes stop_codon:yes gene_type:complete
MCIPYPMELLEYSPWETVIKLIEKDCDHPLSCEQCELIAVDVLEPARIEVCVGIKNTEGIQKHLPPTTQCFLLLERLDIQEHLLPYQPQYPGPYYKNTHEIIIDCRQQLDELYLTIDDFELEDIPVNAKEWTLRAKVDSLRWYGESVIHFPRS